jgi:hypothetical protein
MPRKQKKHHFIYKTTNVVNGKYYVGMHSTDDLEDGYLGSGKYLWRSINKYGPDKFVIERLEFFDKREDMAEREKTLVNDNLLKDPLCMNLKLGGVGGWTVEQQIKNGKNSAVKRQELLKNPEWFAKFSKNMSAGLVEAYKNGTKVAVLPDWNGRKHSKETIDKLSKRAQQRTGNKNSQFGTCWVYKNKVNKKIKKTELNKYLKRKWIKGRKML